MGYSSAYSGDFVPTNTKKYKGNLKNIKYRSSWEQFFMRWCDNNPEVESWNSEEMVVPYFSTADNKNRRYFMDFWVRFTNGQEFLFEVKPYKETQIPSKPKKMTAKAKERFINECYTYTVNQDKWKATKNLCDKSGRFQFRLITEHTLKKLGWRG